MPKLPAEDYLVAGGFLLCVVLVVCGYEVRDLLMGLGAYKGASVADSKFIDKPQGTEV